MRATVAFAAGEAVNTKSGRHVELEQRVLNRAIWRAGDTSHNPTWSGRDFTLNHVDTQSVDVAVGMCLTHDVATAVKRDLAGASPGVGRPLIATKQGGTKSRAIASGQQAFDRAESIGQRQPRMGSVTLYEFDFEVQRVAAMRPRLRFRSRRLRGSLASAPTPHWRLPIAAA